MGPRTSIRGNGPTCPWTDDGKAGFNGAADFHPRKQRLRRTGRCASPSFNGAADFHPRKLDPLPLACPVKRASMGPRTSIRGNAIPSSSTCSSATGFNGAADFHPRKHARVKAMVAEGEALQWGRGLPSAETGRTPTPETASRCFNGAADFHPRKHGRARRRRVRVPHASMGPRTSIRGNPVSGVSGSRSWSLQWGRGLPSAETRSTGP